MSTLSKLTVLALAAALGIATAQETALDPRTSLKIDLPADSPIGLITADMGESRASVRGGAMVLDLHAGLALRNSGQRRIRGVTLLVLAQDVTPGGKASVTVPSLDVGPGQSFPVRVDLRLLRPLQAGATPLVQIGLDGVLFDDLSFFGPNRLNCRRAMTALELEARRDRQYFKSVLQASGPDALRGEVLSSLARQADRPRLDVQVSRGRATNLDPGRQVQFAFLRLPDAPVEPMDGLARVSGSEAHAPRLEVRNRSDRPVRYFEIGWILRDRMGREFLAGNVPAEANLAPGQKGYVSPDTSLRFSRSPGQPLVIDGMSGFVSQVEFSDGSLWVPSRASLGDARLKAVLAPSPEEQRLTQLYRSKGLSALIEELKRF